MLKEIGVLLYLTKSILIQTHSANRIYKCETIVTKTSDNLTYKNQPVHIHNSPKHPSSVSDNVQLVTNGTWSGDEKTVNPRT